MRTLIAAAFVAGGMVLAVAPVAHADPGACVAAGNTVEYCDQHFLSAIDSTGLDYDAATAIRVGHGMADYFAAHPTKAGFVAQVNRFIKDTIEGNCLPDTPGCHADDINVDQAVFVVQRAVIFYGPPGLEDTMNQVMAEG